MTLLIGNNTGNPSGVAESLGNTIFACQFTCLATGTIDTISMHETLQADATVTGMQLGIFSDDGGTAPNNRPQTLLGQGTFTGRPAANTDFSATGLSIPVTSGTIYWLAVVALGSGSFNYYFNDATANGSGTLTVLGSAAATDLSQSPGTWSPFTIGPEPIYATGSTAALDLNIYRIN